MFKSTFHKQATLSRILSGQFRFRLNGVDYISVANTIEERAEADYMAMQIYDDQIEIDSEDKLVELSIETDLWDAEKESNLKVLESDLKEKKKDIYRAVLTKQTADANRLKIDLRAIEKAINHLYGEKYTFGNLSRERLAANVKQKFLILKSIRLNGNPVYHDCWNVPDSVSEKIAYIFLEHKITEEQLRELARTEPWRSTWNIGNPFTNLLNLTDEQKTLVVWSKIYDNVYESSECPPQYIIDDDDALDGWLYIQRERREAELAVKNLDESNPKMAKANERFMSTKDTKYIGEGRYSHTFNKHKIAETNLLNTDEAKRMKKLRLEYIQENGTVPEHLMPDTKAELIMEFNRNLHANAKRY